MVRSIARWSFPSTSIPPNPANFHAVFGISANVAFNPGTALQIDVSGDSDIGLANMGVNPTHAAILPNNSRVFVASAGGNLYQEERTSSRRSFPPVIVSTATGLGTTTTFTLPNVATIQPSPVTINAISEAGNLVTVSLTAPLPNATVGSQVVIQNVVIPTTPPNLAYDGCFKIVTLNGATFQYVNPNTSLPPLSGGGTATLPTSVPTFRITSRPAKPMPSTSPTTELRMIRIAISAARTPLWPSTLSLNTITNLVYLPPGSHPVAMVETPDGQNLYVLNQGSNSGLRSFPQDLSTYGHDPGRQPPHVGGLRPDGRRVYVVTQGDGQLYTIDTDTNAVIPGSPQSVGGAGANFVLYDKSRNRLYVTNPTAGAVYVFDATTDPPTPLCARSSQGRYAPREVQRVFPFPLRKCRSTLDLCHLHLFLQCGDARVSGGFARWHPVLRGELCHGNGHSSRLPGPERNRCRPDASFRKSRYSMPLL